MATSSTASGLTKTKLKATLTQLKKAAEAAPDALTDEHQRRELMEATMKLMQALQRPEDLIINVAFAPGYSMCARVAIDLDLFGLIVKQEGPISADDLAKASGADRTLVVRILRPLTALNFLKEVDEQTYEANANTHSMTKPGNRAGIIHFFDQALPSYAKTPEFLKAHGYQSPEDPIGGPYQYAFNVKQNTYLYWVQNKAILDNFDTFMNGAKLANRRRWTEWFPSQDCFIDGSSQDPQEALLVDVGGGRGHDLLAFKEAYPDAVGKLVLQDLPGVIESITGLDVSIERLKHDYNTEQPIKGARVYFFQGIMHNNGHGTCQNILRQIAGAMKKGYSKILISDVVLPSTKCPLPAVGLDLGMMAMHSGMERSASQWSELFHSVGLELVQVYHDDETDSAMVEGQLKSA